MSTFPPPPPGAPQDQTGRLYPAWDAWFRQTLPSYIGTVIPGGIPIAYTSNPAMNGTASPGNSPYWSMGNHIHPSDTSKADVTALSAYATTASLSAYATLASPSFTGSIKFATVQILTSQQTGMGATLSAATAGATYTATERTMLQNAYDKVLALETKLKTHGLIAT